MSAVRACPVDVGGGRTVTFHVDEGAEDPISAQLIAGRHPNGDTVVLLRALTRRRSRVLDIGAHLGTVGLACAALGRRVTLIEASPRNVELLRLSAAPFGAAVTVIHAAVSDTAGTLTFASNGPFGLVADSEATRTFGHLSEVRADAVDDLVQAGRFRRFAAVKLDVEGYEVAALRGMRRTLRHRPPLVVESNGHTLHLYGESPRTLRAALLELGYEVFEIRGTSLRATTPTALQVTLLTDVLALRPGAHPPDGFEVAPAPTVDEIEAEVAAADRALPAQVAYLTREGVAIDSA